MQTIDQTEPSINVEESKISGFDSGTRSIFKEPTLYFSILGFLAISGFALFKTPTLFWTVFLALSAVSVIFHILAERFLFSSRTSNKHFTAPYEGLFVAVFGSLLPGISLLTYSLYSLLTSAHSNYVAEIGKMGLLLLVPALNFIVWSCIRRHYLSRPRLVGMMNGISLGLSFSWTAIWLKTCMFSSMMAGCKFGWMFLLCVSPLLFLAALLLQIDLCKKTEAHIAKITGVFSILGALVSVLFVATPVVHILAVQAALHDAKQANPSEREKSIAYIQEIATIEDLRPSEYRAGGLELGGMLVSNRGLEDSDEQSKDLFFKITGQPFHQRGSLAYNPKTWKAPDELNTNAQIGAKIPGLSLVKSQMNGSIDAKTLSAIVEWTLNFHYQGNGSAEARAEIALPPGAVVSDATIWLNNQPYTGVIMPTHVPDAKYRTPVLVSSSGTNKVILQCIPTEANGSDKKLRLRFILPLLVKDNKCELNLPKIGEANFGQPKRIRLHLQSKDAFVGTVSSTITKFENGYSYDDIIKNQNPDEPTGISVCIRANEDASPVAIKDPFASSPQYLIQYIRELRIHGPKALVIVVDSSELMKPYISEIKTALAKIPNRLKSQVYFAKTASPGTQTRPLELNASLSKISPENFGGGQDNSSVLREALESAAEKPQSAVLWIHGPQPLQGNGIDTPPLDLVNPVHLYDFEVQAGPDELIKPLGLANSQNGSIYKHVERSASVASDLTTLFQSWNSVVSSKYICRTGSKTLPIAAIASGESQQLAIATLWANDEVNRLIERGLAREAEQLACRYHIVTPISQIALSLEETKLVDPNFAPDTGKVKITYVGNTAFATQAPTAPPIIGGNNEDRSPALIGGPVDPRYGQSNEIGSLADYGYDTARDILRGVTALSSMLSIFLAYLMIKRRKPGDYRIMVKAGLFAVGMPLLVHLLGTFLINNFGGLGGGL